MSSCMDYDGCRGGGPSCSACAFVRISEAVRCSGVHDVLSSGSPSSLPPYHAHWMSIQYLLGGCASKRLRYRSRRLQS